MTDRNRPLLRIGMMVVVSVPVRDIAFLQVAIDHRMKVGFLDRSINKDSDMHMAVTVLMFLDDKCVFPSLSLESVTE